jgi:putative methylase
LNLSTYPNYIIIIDYGEVRIMKKKKLEILLSGLKTFKAPKAHLEQYTTPSHIAGDILYFAHSMGDIDGKRVIDLGCGCGIFAIGAALLGAKSVMGMDVDEGAIVTAKENAHDLSLDIEFQVCDIEGFNEKGDCVIQNPPFGAQNRHADRPFLEKALEVSDVVYSLHLSKTRDFVEKLTNKLNADITHAKSYEFEIPHTYSFHTNEKRDFEISMFRLTKGERGHDKGQEDSTAR